MTSKGKQKVAVITPFNPNEASTSSAVVSRTIEQEEDTKEFAVHRLVESLVVDGKPIAKFVWNGHWNEVRR